MVGSEGSPGGASVSREMEIPPASSAATAEATSSSGAAENAVAPAAQEEGAPVLLSRISSGAPAMEHDASGGPAVASEAPQQHQQLQDYGGVEQRRAMELLRSVDEEGDSGGQVIVCTAPDPDANDEQSLPPTPTAATAAAAAATVGHSLAHRSLSSEKGAAAEAQAPFIGTSGTTDASAAAEAGDRRAAAGAAAVASEALGADDSYIAQLTMKALEHEREDVLKVNKLTTSHSKQ